MWTLRWLACSVHALDTKYLYRDLISKCLWKTGFGPRIIIFLLKVCFTNHGCEINDGCVFALDMCNNGHIRILLTFKENLKLWIYVIIFSQVQAIYQGLGTSPISKYFVIIINHFYCMTWIYRGMHFYFKSWSHWYTVYIGWVREPLCNKYFYVTMVLDMRGLGTQLYTTDAIQG